MKFKTLIKIAAVAFVASLAINVQAQELKLNYAGGSVTLPLDQNRNLNINPINGNVEVSTTNSADQIGEGLALSCTGDVPDVNLTKTINGNSSANINWNLGNDPVYCEKSGQWSGFLPGNPLVSNSSETVFSNGSYVMTCYNAFGSNSDTEVVSNIISVNPPTLSLSASPTTIDAGDSVTLTWNIGNSPTQCTKSGNWPVNGQLPSNEITNGIHSQVINNVTLNRSYSLQCSNSAGSTSVQTASVSIAVENSWPSCSGSAASILNGNEDRLILAQGFSAPTAYNGFYSDIYNNSGTGSPQPWPGSIGSSINLNLEKNKYIAAKFTTPIQNIDAQFLSQIPSNNEGVPPSGYTVTISECPGDFTVHLNQPACKKSAASFRWTTNQNSTAPAGFFCELEQNKTYYLNIVHSVNQGNNNYETTTCGASTSGCGHLSSQNLVQVR